MYTNKFAKSELKCGRIFRPWDQEYQDATVSTTTKEAFQRIKVEDAPKLDAADKKHEDKSVNFDRVPPSYPDLTQMENFGLYGDCSSAQCLGVSSADALFFETMSQGYALEEYARVLSEEHQARTLNARKQRPKKYRCPHCNVGFSNNGQLKGHIRIHTGERPFKCDEKDCGKTFTRNEELTRHKRIHSGLRPFPCSHCGKRFGRKDHLKKHSRTHFQPRGGVFAVPVMLPYDTWLNPSYPFVPMFGY